MCKLAEVSAERHHVFSFYYVFSDGASATCCYSGDGESGQTPKPTALFSNYWNYEWAVTSEDAIALSSGKLEDSLSFLDGAEE